MNVRKPLSLTTRQWIAWSLAHGSSLPPAVLDAIEAETDERIADATLRMIRQNAAQSLAPRVKTNPK